MINSIKPLRIGITKRSYPELRNFVHAENSSLHFYLTEDAITVLRKLWHRISGVGYSLFLYSFALPVKSKSDVLHCFNSIALSRQHWVVTFETTLPRCINLPTWVLRFAWQRLASDRCLAIIALSDCARDIFLRDLALNRPNIALESLQKLLSKIQVLHPPQSVLVEDLQKKHLVDFEGTLHLALIGHDFFRKGGLELLVALDELLEEGFDIQLRIVSKMASGDYASLAGKNEISRADALIKKHPNEISLESKLSNEEVLSLLKRSHIVCLPTWGETYGYSVLEGQSAGCAAITTNLRALPEINNSECGWVIEVPKLESGDADIGTAEKKNVFRKMLTNGIKVALLDALNDRQGLRSKSHFSLKRIQAYHDPTVHKAALIQIYSKAH